MYLHILIDSFYTSKFIDFVRQYFDSSSHVFVTFAHNSRYLNSNEVNKLEFLNIKHVRWLYKKMSEADLVFLHSTFCARSLLLLFLNQKCLSKTIWVLWGGDLYNYWLNDSHTIKERVLEKVKGSMIKRIAGIVALVKEDYEFAKEKYNTSAEYIYAFYPNPADFSMLDAASKEVCNRSERRILIGNSAAPSNNHLEILNALARYRMENIEIICPLSYGLQDYANKVQEYGLELFGNRFIALREFLSPTEYARILSNMDVAIFAHRRQQALGNILALLYLGKKVYVRSDISTWSFLNRLGIKVFDTKGILDGLETDLFSLQEQATVRNREIVRSEFSEDHCVQLWKNVFEFCRKL